MLQRGITLPAEEAAGIGRVRHPGGSGRGVDAIAVAAVREASDTVAVSYRLAGALSSLRVPAPTTASRRDGLWRHTCFEAFVAPATAPAYVEFNLSPSGEWAAYRFDAYREGMAALDGPAPRIACRARGDALELHAVLPLPSWLSGVPLRLGLTAVVEDAHGGLGYWALRHPAAAPDFHHPDGFTLEIGRASCRERV